MQAVGLPAGGMEGGGEREREMEELVHAIAEVITEVRFPGGTVSD